MKEQFGQLHKTVEAGQRKIMRRVQRLEHERRQCVAPLPKPKDSESSGSDTALEGNDSSGSNTAPEAGANSTYDSDSSDNSGVVTMNSPAAATEGEAVEMAATEARRGSSE